VIVQNKDWHSKTDKTCGANFLKGFNIKLKKDKTARGRGKK